MPAPSYKREGDRAEMVEFAPHQFVNRASDEALGLIGPKRRDDDAEARP